MPDGPVISNNTPLVALFALGRLDLLRDLYGEVLIPQAVHDEFIATEQARRQSALKRAPWIKVASVVNSKRTLVYIGLDQGEAEVLALAEEQNARLVIIDERKARRYAKRLGFPLTGTLGVLLLAKEKGIIPTLAPLIKQLQQAGLHLGINLVKKVLQLAGEDPLTSK